MNTRIKLKKAQVKPILAATFPKYKGRTYEIEFAPTITFHDTNWGGGSRNYYAFVNADGRTGHLVVPAPWNNTAEGETVEIPADVLIVEHCIFCGKDLGIRIYANPVHLPKWLPA